MLFQGIRMKSVYVIVLCLMTNLLFSISIQEISPILEIEKLIISVRSRYGDVLYAEDFFKLKQLFEELKSQVEGRDMTDIEKREALEIAQALEKIGSAAEKSRPYLSEILHAREEAIANSSEDFAPEQFQKAEEALHKLAEIFEEDMPENAERQISEDLLLYRQAQYQAIRNKLLSEVRILLRESKDLGAQKLAPKTLILVSELLQEVEQILDQKLFNDPSLPEKAARLSAESQHLLNLVQIARRVERDISALEEFILNLEEKIREITTLLDYNPEFFDGISPVLDDIYSSIAELKSENARLFEQNRLLEDSLQAKNEILFELQQKLEKKEDLAQKIARLQNNVDDYGVAVWQQGKEIILRLRGIQFEPGKITVDDELKTVLEIIGRSIQEFSNNNMVVRIGQVAVGNQDYNISLALQRAKSVALILQTAGFIPENRLRSEGILLSPSSEPQYAILEIIIDMNT
jgi:OOP family OmpA-OmpF porin